jgi:hypothetical protein
MLHEKEWRLFLLVNGIVIHLLLRELETMSGEVLKKTECVSKSLQEECISFLKSEEKEQ